MNLWYLLVTLTLVGLSASHPINSKNAGKSRDRGSRNLANLPQGSIIAWVPKVSRDSGYIEPLPRGWQRCDGSTISDPLSPWERHTVPNFNREYRFLRGGTDGDFLKLEEDQIQNHSHEDFGHSHSDPGHTHRDAGHNHQDADHSHTDSGHTHTDSGHTHTFNDESLPSEDGQHCSGSYWGKGGVWRTSFTGYANIQSSSASIHSASANIQSADAQLQSGNARFTEDPSNVMEVDRGELGARVGSETKVKLVNVIWIIKVAEPDDLELDVPAVAKSQASPEEKMQAFTNIMPLGSIIAWVPRPSHETGWNANVPDKWQRCDGSLILDTSSPWITRRTPDFNGENRFLRMGPDSEFLNREEDQIQDHVHVDYGHDHWDNGHTHEDQGHVHIDSGHTHSDSGHSHTDSGHTHKFWDRMLEGSGNMVDGRHWSQRVVGRTTQSGSAQIQSASANIQNSKASIQTGHAQVQTSYASPTTEFANMGGVIGDGVRQGDETRPKAAHIIWIMKIAD